MEARLWEGDPPEWSTPAWYAGRDRAPHVEQLGHTARLLRAKELVTQAQHLWSLNYGHAGTVSDLGAGDGGLLSWLPVHWTTWGFDLQPSNVEGARERGVDVQLVNVLDAPARLFGDISIATEMIEHLVDPHDFVGHTLRHSDLVVASSPAFETAESHYEYHLWAWDVLGYRDLFVEGGWRILEHDVVDGFQVLLAVRSGR